MARPEVRTEPATLEHARQLAGVMRPQDRAELHASGWPDPYAGLAEALWRSDEAWVALFDGEVAAMWGVGPVDNADRSVMEGHGVAWLLTGRAVELHPKQFLRMCRPAVGQLLKRFPVLVNAVDARYTRALRWAKWLGFHVSAETVSVGRELMPFHPITMGGTGGRIH